MTEETITRYVVEKDGKFLDRMRWIFGADPPEALMFESETRAKDWAQTQSATVRRVTLTLHSEEVK